MELIYYYIDNTSPYSLNVSLTYIPWKYSNYIHFDPSDTSQGIP